MGLETIKRNRGMIAKVLLLLLLIAIIAVSTLFTVREVSHDCKYRYSPTYNKLLDSMKLTKDGVFESADGKLLAQVIYNHRRKFEYEFVSKNDYINIFDIHRPEVPPEANALRDIALYKLATCNVIAFSKMVAFAYVFNNEMYMKCINAYDSDNKVFNEVEAGKSTKDIIIKDILKFGNPFIADLKQSIRVKIPTSKLDSSITDSMITALIESLNNMTDEQLYNLITVGLVE